MLADADHVGIDVDAVCTAAGAESGIDGHEAAVASDVQNMVAFPDQVRQIVGIEAFLRATLAEHLQNPERLVGIAMEVGITVIFASLKIKFVPDLLVQLGQPDDETIGCRVDRVHFCQPDELSRRHDHGDAGAMQERSRCHHGMPDELFDLGEGATSTRNLLGHSGLSVLFEAGGSRSALARNAMAVSGRSSSRSGCHTMPVTALSVV